MHTCSQEIKILNYLSIEPNFLSCFNLRSPGLPSGRPGDLVQTMETQSLIYVIVGYFSYLNNLNTSI